MADPYYATRYVPDERRAPVWGVLCGRIARDLPPAPRLLELGAGYCAFINQIPAREKHALDRSADFLPHAAADVTAHVGDAADLSRFADASFDAVFASNLLEHLRPDESLRLREEVRRILRPGGRFLLLQPNYAACPGRYWEDPTHVQRFTHRSLARFLEAGGFRVRRLIPRWIPFSFRSNLPAWPWLVRLYLGLPIRPLAAQVYCVAEKPARVEPTEPVGRPARL
jgi:SAM-dependent methyltransferase